MGIMVGRHFWQLSRIGWNNVLPVRVMNWAAHILHDILTCITFHTIEWPTDLTNHLYYHNDEMELSGLAIRCIIPGWFHFQSVGIPWALLFSGFGSSILWTTVLCMAKIDNFYSLIHLCQLVMIGFYLQLRWLQRFCITFHEILSGVRVNVTNNEFAKFVWG